MATTAFDIIVKAFYLINEYSPEEMPSAAEIEEGLYYLNELLDSFSATGIMIPFTEDYSFNTEPSKAVYTFGLDTRFADNITPQFRQIMDAYITTSDINYPIIQISHEQAKQLVRYPNATSRPTQLFFQQHNNYSSIELYNTPDQVYSIVLRAKFDLLNVELTRPMEDLPKYYHRVLRYALAKELSSVFETNTWDDKKEGVLSQMLSDLKPANDLDVSLELSTAINSNYDGSSYSSIITM